MNQPNNPTVSVIIPTYNSVTTIIHALESVFNQTCPHFEVIVIDDGSTDDTKQVLQHFIDQKKIVYIHQKNQGCGAARNNGVKIAKGEFVAFLDADDYWHDEKLELQMEIFSNNKECIMCYTDAYEIDPYHAIIWDVRHPKSGGLVSGRVLQHLVFRNFITLSSGIVKTSFFHRAGAFTEKYDLMMVADYDLWLRLAPMGEFCAIQTPLVFYQTRPSISRKQKIENHRQVMSVFMLRIQESSWENTIWYIIGWCVSSFKWAAHSLLEFLHL